jgi:hypothetical protein
MVFKIVAHGLLPILRAPTAANPRRPPPQSRINSAVISKPRQMTDIAAEFLNCRRGQRRRFAISHSIEKG